MVRTEETKLWKNMKNKKTIGESSPLSDPEPKRTTTEVVAKEKNEGGSERESEESELDWTSSGTNYGRKRE